jgi:hypothetical protein
MRARASAATRDQGPFNPLPASIFTERVLAMPGEANATARKFANQMAYNRQGGDAYAHWYGYTGPGFIGSGTGRVRFNIATFSIAVFVVPENQPTVKMLYVNQAGEPEPPGANGNLQAAMEAVPLPTLSKVPSGNLVCPTGTDQWLAIWQPATDRYWEMGTGASSGKSITEHTFRHGAFVDGVSKWNGLMGSIGPTSSKWGERAPKLALIGGMISTQDMVEILQGKKLKHALAINTPVTNATGPVAPATSQDKKENGIAEIEGTPNPAFGSVDAVAEASWFRFPAASTPAEYGISQATNPIAWAIFEAIREYGCFVADSTEAPASFNIQYPTELGSPYAWAHVNPYQGAPTGQGWGVPYMWVPGAMADFTLSPIAVPAEGSSGPLNKMPWQILEQVEPRSA